VGLRDDAEREKHRIAEQEARSAAREREREAGEFAEVRQEITGRLAEWANKIGLKRAPDITETSRDSREGDWDFETGPGDKVVSIQFQFEEDGLHFDGSCAITESHWRKKTTGFGVYLHDDPGRYKVKIESPADIGRVLLLIQRADLDKE